MSATIDLMDLVEKKYLDLKRDYEAELNKQVLEVLDEVIPAILNEFDWATENEIKAIEYGVDALRDQIKQRIEGDV